MSITPTYPGVYVTEVPSGNRTISGVAPSVTALVGTALRGPVDVPVPISNFTEFERTFGGLVRDSGLGYAVRDFYLRPGYLAKRLAAVKSPAELIAQSREGIALILRNL